MKKKNLQPMSWVVLFIFGAIFGAFCDGFHTHSGTEVYPHPWLFMMAWWVPLLFGSATVAIAASHLAFDERTRHRPRFVAGGEVISGVALFAVLYFVSGFMKTDLLPKLIVMGVFALAHWQILEGTISGLKLAFATALVGCLVEIILIKLGLFYYTAPDFLGLPLWLPFLYVTASVTTANMARVMTRG